MFSGSSGRGKSDRRGGNISKLISNRKSEKYFSGRFCFQFAAKTQSSTKSDEYLSDLMSGMLRMFPKHTDISAYMFISRLCHHNLPEYKIQKNRFFPKNPVF